MQHYLVFDIGGTFVKYGVLTGEGDILLRGKYPTACFDLSLFMDRLLKTVNELRADWNPAGIAVSMAGILDVPRGFALTGGAVRSITNYPMAEELSRLTGGLPVTIENDAKAALLAEYWKGNLQNTSNAVAFIIGTGIGGAVLADGRLLRGSHFFAGEFSYILREHGSETYVLGDPKGLGVPGLLAMAAERLPRAESVRSGENEISQSEPLTGETFFRLVSEGSPEANACLTDYAHAIAVQLFNIMAVVDPERIVIGGGVSVQPALIEAIRNAFAEVAKEYLPEIIRLPEILPCRFHNDSNLIGALYAHRSRDQKQFCR